MNDYDFVRSCCSGANICNKCWKFMIAAGEVLHESLVKDFGFENILWVFSGRRGIHLWICDKVAREMQNEVRSAVIENLSLISGNEHSGSKLKKGMLSEKFIHP